MPLESTTGENLAKTIIRALKELNIDLNFLRDQGYDGAASMKWAADSEERKHTLLNNVQLLVIFTVFLTVWTKQFQIYRKSDQYEIALG